jgi:hypothetical protein
VKIKITLPPPGIVNVPQFGTASPAVGFEVAGRLAPPIKVTVTVVLYVKPVGRVSETVRLEAALRFAAFETVIV